MLQANRGKLIVIDGIDGSGKATQTKILLEKIKEAGLMVETIDFPQYEKNFFGRMVRRYLNGEFGPATTVNPYLASTLYAADRWESAETIKQWLDQGKIVLLDRYYTSNLIHQGTKLTYSELDDFIIWDESMEFNTFKIPKPDLVIYLHLDAAIAYELITKRGQGHDGHDTTQHLKQAEERCSYLAKKLNWLTVECSQNGQLLEIETIAENIWQQAKKIINI
ncbi:MAG: dTMP kinase [Patescibacteria group bacterium]